jgi:hypothetical protein
MICVGKVDHAVCLPVCVTPLAVAGIGKSGQLFFWLFIKIARANLDLQRQCVDPHAPIAIARLLSFWLDGETCEILHLFSQPLGKIGPVERAVDVDSRILKHGEDVGLIGPFVAWDFDNDVRLANVVANREKAFWLGDLGATGDDDGQLNVSNIAFIGEDVELQFETAMELDVETLIIDDILSVAGIPQRDVLTAAQPSRESLFGLKA